MSSAAQHVDDAPDVVAPDGSVVRVLVRTQRGSMARFSLPAGAVSRAVAHRTVEEVWYVIAGSGRMWLRCGEAETVVEVQPGVSIAIPVGTAFQFRASPDASLQAIGVTMPPWPGEDEAIVVQGPWMPTV